MKTIKAPVLSVRGLKQHFITGFGKNKLVVKAVDGVSFDIFKGEVFSLVGESGCGKTTTGRTIIKLYEPTEGEVYFLGKRISAEEKVIKTEIAALKKEAKKAISDARYSSKLKISQIKTECDQEITNLNIEKNSTNDVERANSINLEIKKIKDKAKADFNEYKQNFENVKNEWKEKISRLKLKEDKELMKKMQMIFQDPIASLNPRMIVKEIIAEGLRIAGEKDSKVINQRVNDMLKTVGLLPEHASRYPHEFSGGQRQRIGIARALAVSPEFIIADEPISALDVSIQAQVINLLNDLRDKFGITILFIAHDLSVVKYFSDRIGVMYYGKLVELASKEELFKNPLHPYTQSLLSAVPLPDPNYEKSRVRMVYDPSTHDYNLDKPSLHEIKEGHFIYANEAELETYKKRMKA